MLEFIEEILSKFRKCFSRTAAYSWFVTIVTGLMIRSDHLGVTSVIRDLGLRPKFYETMMHFFRATSWKLEEVRKVWCEIVRKYAPICTEQGFTILIGDGVKQSKEGCYMPGVKKLVQESEDSSKPRYIFGHMFGALGILIGNTSKRFCLPLSIRLHDGVQFLKSWEKASIAAASHVIQMVDDGYEAAKTFGNSLLLLDRYFLSVPALKELAKLNGEGPVRMEIVTKAKQNCVAYELPQKRSGRGRPAKKGAKVSLRNLFSAERTSFQKATLDLYGKQTNVEYYCIDLLWGISLYQKLRFVLVKYGNTQSILVSTCLEFPPERIICLYCYRFSIEACFRELKQQIGAFCYHFWTKAMPKLGHFQKKGTPDPLENVSDSKLRSRIQAAVQATERFVMLSCIAMGSLQMIALKFTGCINPSTFRYLRTPSHAVVSEATVMSFLRKNIFRLMAFHPDFTISRFILDKSCFPHASSAA